MSAITNIFDKISTTDATIVVTFLILNLFVGVYFSRGITNIREYALGGRNFSQGTLVATIVATWMSGHALPFVVYETYQDGLYFIIPLIADALAFLIIAYSYAPRMKEFLGNLSVAEAMGNMFGKYIRAITALSGLVVAIGAVAMQFIILSSLLTGFLGVSGFYAVILSSAVVIIYSTFGGIKAVTFTDVIQFFTFGVIIPVTAFYMWCAIDDNATLVLNLFNNHPFFDFSNVFDYNNPKFITAAGIFFFFLIPCLDPTHFQRIAMACNVRQVIKSFAIASIIMIFCQYLVFNFIGILLLADPNTPSDVSTFDTNNLITYVIDHYLEVGLKGLFVIGVMSMSMSTADSYINSGAVLFSHDLCKTVGFELSEKSQLHFTRFISCIIGIISLVVSLYFKNIWWLIYASYSFYMPIVSLPLILAIFGFRSSGLAVFLGMLGGFLTVCGLKIFTDIDNVILFGMIANLITYMSSHYLLNQSGGWVGIKEKDEFLSIRNERRAMLRDFYLSIVHFNIINYLKNSSSKQDAKYVSIGFFAAVSIFSSLYALPKNVTDNQQSLIDVISYTTMFLSTIMVTYPAWMEAFKNRVFISFISHMTIFCVLIVGSSLLVLASHFHHLQLVILTASLITTAILLRWYVTLTFIITGITGTVVFYTYYISAGIVFNNMTTEFSVIYVILIASAISVVFLKPKEDALEISEARSDDLWSKINEMEIELQKANNLKTEFLNNISHEVRTPMTGITSLGQALWEGYDAIPEVERKKCIHDIAKSSDRLISLMNNILDLSALTSLRIELKLQKVNLSILVQESIKKCKKLYLENKILQFNVQIEDDIYVKCDEHYIGNTVDNLIINAISYSKPGTIVHITLHRQNGNVEFAIRDEGIGVPQEELFDIFRPFTVSSQTRTPAGGRGVGLSLCYGAIIAHKGKIWAESDGKSWAEFKFTL